MTVPSTSSSAKALGISRFNTGKPCRYGHFSDRYTVSYSCVECHRVATADHRASGKHSAAFKVWRDDKRSKEPEYFLHQAAKARAKKLDLPFNLTVDDVKSAWPIDNCCPVFGTTLANLSDAKGKVREDSPSIDRRNPALGYVVGNIAIISMRANYMKSNFTDPSDFRKMADWLESF